MIVIIVVALAIVVAIVAINRAARHGGGTQGESDYSASPDLFASTPLMSMSDGYSSSSDDASCDVSDSGGWDSGGDSGGDCGSDSGGGGD